MSEMVASETQQITIASNHAPPVEAPKIRSQCVCLKHQWPLSQPRIVYEPAVQTGKEKQAMAGEGAMHNTFL